MVKAKKLSADVSGRIPTIGVFATCDPRIDKDSRVRAGNIVQMTADRLAAAISLPDGTEGRVRHSATDFIIQTNNGWSWTAPHYSKGTGTLIYIDVAAIRVNAWLR